MLRTPKLPEKKKHEFDPITFEREKNWLKKRIDGKLVSSKTSGSWWLVIWTAMIFAFIIGGSIGALFASFLGNINILYFCLILVFTISTIFLRHDYAKIEFDIEERTMLYEGIVNYGGEDRSVRYMGPIEVIEGTQLVKHHRFKKKFIRFTTRSGYLRVSYKPNTEDDFLETLEFLGLINLNNAKETLLKLEPIKRSNEWNVYYEEVFDRSEFFAKMKKEKAEKEKKDELVKKVRRDLLIARSKTQKERIQARLEQDEISALDT